MTDDRPTCEECGRRFTWLWDVQTSPVLCPACLFAHDDGEEDSSPLKLPAPPVGGTAPPNQDHTTS
jgi:hypothetical protein